MIFSKKAQENKIPLENRPAVKEILDHISQCVVITDLNGIITYWNAASEKLFGYSREEILNESIANIYPEVAKCKLQEDLKLLREGQKVRGEWKAITKEGKVIWIDVDIRPVKDEEGKPISIVGSVHEIQELKRLEKELEENIAQAQAILETTIDGIITVDDEGTIKRFNQAASKIFGYTEEEVLGQNVKVIVPELYNYSHNDYLKRYRETGKSRFIGYRRELTGQRKDGSIFPMELAVSEVQWEGNKLFTGVINDISERRRLEKEILRISEEERRNLGQDLHDGLGQMLTGISLISQNLARKLNSEDKTVAKEVEDISNLVKEADEYAKALAHGLINVSFEEKGLQAALYQLSNQAEKFFNVRCTCNCDDNLKINNQMKAMNLYRIAQESISNAAKHGKAQEIAINLRAENKTIKLSIEDNGIGFSKSARDKKKKGMGIYIMKYRANMMSGNLEISKTEDNRTAVICSIPQNNF